jgi:hypothetical protein
MTDAEFWIQSWSKRRAKCIAEYLRIKATKNKPNINYWRESALHYGRLVRKLKQGAV